MLDLVYIGKDDKSELRITPLEDSKGLYITVRDIVKREELGIVLDKQALQHLQRYLDSL